MALADKHIALLSDDSDASLDDDEKYEDREALTRCRQALGLSINYVRTWSPRDGFREFFQNWKDAITETFGLGPRPFRLDITDNRGVYVAEAHHPDTDDLLGFVRYTEKDGLLELTNFKAKLNRASLALGITSKREQEHLAGTHGGGFKLAALVMVRAGYQARIETSNYYWRFTFAGRNQSDLYCNLTPISDAKHQKQMHAYASKAEQGKPRELQNNTWEDVSVKIGRVQGPKWGQKIARRDFDEWVKVSIDLDRTTEIVKTSHGSLILDKRFANKVFLKGLLLEGQSEGRDFKYGYDIRLGNVGRDRKSLENSSKESATFANIWGEAIAKHQKDSLSKYVNMLLAQANWADVSQAEKQMSATTAKAIWNYLRTQISGRNKFYHDDKHGDRDIDLIRKSLKKEPAQLPACIWKPLRKFHLVRTPQEERHDLLYSAPVAAEKTTLYASMVKRALHASLCTDTRTKNLEIIFKDGTIAELDLLLDGTQLMINDKWLDFHASHQNAPCWLSRSSTTAGFSSDTFSCDHVIIDLYDMIIMEVDKCPGEQGHGAVEADGLLRLRLVENLHHMPRLIETAPGRNPGEIDVTWLDSEGGLAARLHRLDVRCRVTLHRESTCAMRRHDLVTSNGLSNDEVISSEATQYPAECGCPEQLVSQKDSKTPFRSLEYQESYFPMISRVHAQAFYGVQLSPKGIRPTPLGTFNNHHSTGGTPKRVSNSRGDDVKSLRSKGRERKLEGATKDLDTKSKELQDAQAKIANLTEEKHVLEQNLKGRVEHEAEIKELFSQLLLKCEKFREAQAIQTTSQQEAIDKETRLGQLGSEKRTLETRLSQKDPVYDILHQKLVTTRIKLENERRESHELHLENEEKRNLLDNQEQLLQQKTTELDTERIARHKTDKELRDARENIKALEDDLERVQDNLAQTLQVASSLASRSNAQGRTINRKRIKEETSPGSPSGRQKKRARNGSLHLPEPDPAGNPILLD